MSEFSTAEPVPDGGLTLENKERIDIRWWDRENYREAFARSLTAFYTCDQDLIAKDKEFSAIANAPDRSLSKVVEKIQNQLGVEGLRSRAEIILTLRNAQLSFLIDDLALAFLKEKPISIHEFKARLGGIMRHQETIQRFIDIYRSVLRQYHDDRIERADDEPVEDFIIRTADMGRIVPDWIPDFASDAKVVGETLKWMRAAIEAGDLVREAGPKAGKAIERDVALIKLPFIDVLVCEDTLFYLKQFHLTDDAESRGITYPENYKDGLDLTKLYIGEACIDYKAGKRARLTLGFYSVGFPRLTEKVFEEGALQSLAHARHEIKHYIDQKIRDEKQTGLPNEFYNPQGTFSLNRKSSRTVEEGIRFETQNLLDEARALCVDGKLLSLDTIYGKSLGEEARERPVLEGYVARAISNLASQTIDGDDQSERIQAFRDSWQEILDFLTKQGKALGDMSAEREFRFINLVLYHCIATAETLSDLLLRLKHAVAWIMTEVE